MNQIKICLNLMMAIGGVFLFAGTMTSAESSPRLELTIEISEDNPRPKRFDGAYQILKSGPSHFSDGGEKPRQTFEEKRLVFGTIVDVDSNPAGPGEYRLHLKVTLSNPVNEKKNETDVIVGETIELRGNFQLKKPKRLSLGGKRWCEIRITEAEVYQVRLEDRP